MADNREEVSRMRVLIKAIIEKQPDLVKVLLNIVPITKEVVDKAVYDSTLGVLRVVLEKEEGNKFLLDMRGSYMEFLIRNKRLDMIHFLIENYDIELDNDARYITLDKGFYSIYKYLCKHNLDPKSFHLENMLMHTIDPNTLRDLLKYNDISDKALRSAVHESLYSESVKHIKVLLDYRRESVMQMIPEEFQYNTSIDMINFLEHLGINLCQEFTKHFRDIVQYCLCECMIRIICYLEKHSISFPTYAFDVLDHTPNPCATVEKRRFLDTYVPLSFTKGHKGVSD